MYIFIITKISRSIQAHQSVSGGFIFFFLWHSGTKWKICMWMLSPCRRWSPSQKPICKCMNYSNKTPPRLNPMIWNKRYKEIVEKKSAWFVTFLPPVCILVYQRNTTWLDYSLFIGLIIFFVFDSNKRESVVDRLFFVF